MIHTVLAAGSNDDLTGWDVAGLAVIVAFWLGVVWLITRK